MGASKYWFMVELKTMRVWVVSFEYLRGNHINQGITGYRFGSIGVLPYTIPIFEITFKKKSDKNAFEKYMQEGKQHTKKSIEWFKNYKEKLKGVFNE